MPYRGSDLVELVVGITGKPARKNAKGWVCVCPAHQDDYPSLSIGDGDRGVLLNCFQGCSLKQICQAIGIERHELFYDDKKPTRNRHPNYSAEQRELDQTILALFNLREQQGQESSSSDIERAAEAYRNIQRFK